MTATRLVATVRHGRGTLARLAATLNPHPVTGFVYELGAEDTATLRVTVEGSAWDAERVRVRLSRGVDVLAVRGWPEMTSIVAAAQATPVFLDRDATVEKVCSLVKEAASHGASLVVFPETFVPTYPDWVWRTAAWHDGRYVHRLYNQSVSVPGPATERMGAAAAESGVYVAVGVNEVEGGTLYNTLLYLAPDGALVGRHRKLMPTGGERTVWGMGDGSTLGVVRTPFGVVGGLICWENYMPLARAAMYAQGVDIYLAPTWDNSDTWTATLRHIAKEGRVYVVGVAPLLRGSDVPGELRGELYGGDDDWMSRGLSAIVAPGGELLAGPVAEREEILYAEVDAAIARSSRQQFDPVGHYSRPDVFRLSVDTSPRRPVTFSSPPLPRDHEGSSRSGP